MNPDNDTSPQAVIKQTAIISPIEAAQQAMRDALADATDQLTKRRAERDELNAQIKQLVEQQATLSRVVNAFTARTVKRAKR